MIHAYADFPLPLGQFPFIVGIVLAVIVVVLLYIFRLKPSVELPLPNEEDMGIMQIALPQIGKELNKGRVTTARRTFQGWFAKAITSAEATQEKSLLTLRDEVLKGHLFAQKADRNKILYHFDKDPLDTRYHTRLDKPGAFGTTPNRWVGPVLDAETVGKIEDFEVVKVKLGMEKVEFTDVERERNRAFMETLGYIKRAATNLGRVKFLEGQVKSVRDILEEERKDNAETNSKLDRALRALKRQPLTVSEADAKVPGALAMRMKEWFTWPQIVCAGVGYLVAPQIISQFWPTMAPPNTTYVTALITIAAFFLIPFGRKVFGRWL